MENIKNDSRPQRYSWAPGEYICTCISCQERFAGDKRAGLCADCAYALPEPGTFAPPENRVLNCLEATNAELSGADKAIAALKEELENIKVRNVINAIKEICPDCGHTLDENDECANCWKTGYESMHAEFGPIYAALSCFLKDWKDGDFTLPRLAEIHAEKLRELIVVEDAEAGEGPA